MSVKEKPTTPPTMASFLQHTKSTPPAKKGPLRPSLFRQGLGHSWRTPPPCRIDRRVDGWQASNFRPLPEAVHPEGGIDLDGMVEQLRHSRSGERLFFGSVEENRAVLQRDHAADFRNHIGQMMRDQ